VKHWITAARPKTLPLGISGVLLGAGMAFMNGGFRVSQLLLILITAVFLQVLSNFANDYGDFIKNTDTHANRQDRMLASGKISVSTMKWVLVFWSIATLALGLVLLFPFFKKGNTYWGFLALGLLAIFSAIKYTVGKFALAYNALGDLFVFVFFGLVSVCGTHFLLADFLQPRVWLAGLGMGLLCTAVLNVNNMRDFDSDRIAGKSTLVGKFGLPISLFYHKLLVLLGYVCIMGSFLAGEESLALRSSISESLMFILASSPFVLLFTGHVSAVSGLVKTADSSKDLWNLQLRNLSQTILGFVLFYGLCCWLFAV
jgi:1,4-dihydroxy-2-naphthoate octaprenyltransferase